MHQLRSDMIDELSEGHATSHPEPLSANGWIDRRMTDGEADGDDSIKLS